MTEQNMELNAALELCKELDKKFGQDIVLMDLRELTPIADYFILVTGSSAPQLADVSEEMLIAHGMKLKHREGVNSANWILLDFGLVVVHLFDKEARGFYNLDRTWGDAKVVAIQ